MSAIVVMGVSAAGKSTVAAALSARLDRRLVDADDLHPPANVEKMAAGIPLDDADRAPWLDAVGAALADDAAGRGAVVACSALRRIYRDRLRAAGDVVFVHLDADRAVLAFRASARENHFMPPALLESQLATLEPLSNDERGVVIDVDAPLADVVDAAAEWIERHDR
ncbi:gluconokinase [Microbacterium sp. NPDC089189]|uniref:gluconokinase n=1 Tax=Microbacterium sp. NPDC089189 TaxID=3154972 RepID=UPI0034139A4D